MLGSFAWFTFLLAASAIAVASSIYAQLSNAEKRITKLEVEVAALKAGQSN